MQKIDTDSIALDLLAVCREVASDHATLNRLLEGLFSGPEADTEFIGLLRAVTRLRFLERSILDSLASVSGSGPIDAAEIYKDASRSVIMAALVHSEESAARLRSYYPHLLSESDIERARLTVRTGMSREDLSKATEYLAAVEQRLKDRLDP
jgi:hypothetical protein